MWKIFIFIKYKIFSLYPLPFPHRTSENVVTRIGIALQNPALPVRGQGQYHHRTLAVRPCKRRVLAYIIFLCKGTMGRKGIFKKLIYQIAEKVHS